MGLDVGSLTRSRLLLNHVCSEETWEEQSQERAEGARPKRRRFGRIQRGHQPVCDAKVTDFDTASSQEIPMILRASLSTASRRARCEAGAPSQWGEQYFIPENRQKLREW